MRTPEPRGGRPEGTRGPTPRALLALALGALALLATSSLPPTLDGHAIGEVVLGGGQSAERDLRIHVDPAGGGAARGAISTSFQAASGLDAGYTGDATIELASASDAVGSFAPAPAIPVERCATGCDLTYRIRITAAPSVLPGSVIRYEVGVRFEYDNRGGGPLDPGLMRLDLDGAATGPVAPLWSILAGLLALALGVAAGPRVDRALGSRRRRWPALGLATLAIAMIGWMVVIGTIFISRYDLLGRLAGPQLLLVFADPWSVALLGTLAWGLRRGLARWPADGGWLLGMAAVATAGLGGLWWTWSSTIDAVIQPMVLAGELGLLGGLGGVVVGQAWRTDPAAGHDRWWAAFGVLGHGVVIAGFGFLAQRFLYDPYEATPVSIPALIPAALVAWAFRRWLVGRRGWLIAFDLAIAATGIIGVWLWSSVSHGYALGPFRIGIEDVAVGLAVVASLVALVTALHPMPRPAEPVPTTPPPPPSSPARTDAGGPPLPADAGPSAT